MTWNLKPAFAHLLTAKLVYAVCPEPKCKRGSWWASFPAKCKKLGCGGVLEGK